MQAIGRQSEGATDGAPVHYERHRPKQTTLDRLVQLHAASVIAHTEASTGSGLPRFIKYEFDAFIECAILVHGFLRLRCGDCGHEKLLALLQAPRVLSAMSRTPDVAHRGAPGRSRHPARAGAPLHCPALDGVYWCGGDGVPLR